MFTEGPTEFPVGIKEQLAQAASEFPLVIKKSGLKFAAECSAVIKQLRSTKEGKNYSQKLLTEGIAE